MSAVTNTNSSTANNLATSDARRQTSLNRLSSGVKIVRLADDADGLAVSIKVSAAARRPGAVAVNIGNAVSLVQTRDGALEVSAKILERTNARRPRSTCSHKKLRA